MDTARHRKQKELVCRFGRAIHHTLRETYDTRAICRRLSDGWLPRSIRGSIAAPDTIRIELPSAPHRVINGLPASTGSNGYWVGRKINLVRPPNRMSLVGSLKYVRIKGDTLATGASALINKFFGDRPFLRVSRPSPPPSLPRGVSQ